MGSQGGDRAADINIPQGPATAFPPSAAAVPPSSFLALSRPMECWHFDLACPPDSSSTRTLDVEVQAEGSWNAVAYWGEVRLYEELVMSTGEAEGSRNAVAYWAEVRLYEELVLSTGEAEGSRNAVAYWGEVRLYEELR